MHCCRALWNTNLVWLFFTPTERLIKGVVLTQDFAREPVHRADPPTRWQENHGNLLLGFVGIVMITGGGILFYRQHRFVPPRFPEEKMIAAPAASVESAKDDQNDANIMVRVTGAISDNGAIKLAVFGSESAYDESKATLAYQSSLIVDGVSEWAIPFEELPRRFAIAAYHDENNDDDLNRNRLGIPTERYGFTRDARGLSGRPSYKQSVIDRPPKGGVLSISIR